jgi:hypothetical protein
MERRVERDTRTSGGPSHFPYLEGEVVLLDRHFDEELVSLDLWHVS